MGLSNLGAKCSPLNYSIWPFSRPHLLLSHTPHQPYFVLLLGWNVICCLLHPCFPLVPPTTGMWPQQDLPDGNVAPELKRLPYSQCRLLILLCGTFKFLQFIKEAECSCYVRFLLTEVAGSSQYGPHNQPC